MSHPAWVRGLKHPFAAALMQIPLSHPAWVRGLKHQIPYTPEYV